MVNSMVKPMGSVDSFVRPQRDALETPDRQALITLSIKSVRYL